MPRTFIYMYITLHFFKTSVQRLRLFFRCESITLIFSSASEVIHIAGFYINLQWYFILCICAHKFLLLMANFSRYILS